MLSIFVFLKRLHWCCCGCNQLLPGAGLGGEQAEGSGGEHPAGLCEDRKVTGKEWVLTFSDNNAGTSLCLTSPAVLCHHPQGGLVLMGWGLCTHLHFSITF